MRNLTSPATGTGRALSACARLAALLITAVTPAAAATAPPDGAVEIRSRAILQVKTPYGRSSPEKRARHAETVLAPLLGRGAVSVEARKDTTGWGVWAAGTLVLRATPAEAKAHGASPAALATRWAGAISRVVNMPAVKLPSREVTVPVGEKRTIPIDGYVESGLRVAVNGAAVRAELQGRSVVLHGLSEGRGELTVSAPAGKSGETRSATCAVVVRKYAGSLSRVTTAITGSPAPSSLAEDAAAFALRQELPREAGATVTVTGSLKGARQTGPGETTTISARVRIEGANYLPLEGEAQVTVRNLSLPHRDARVLLYSNNPERITGTGSLFAGAVEGDAPSRLFYHHVNNLTEAVALTVRLVNPGDRPAEVQLVPGFSPPDSDPIRSGHKAGRAFFRSYRQNLGEIITVPARSSLLLRVDRLRPNETASGIAELRLMEPTKSRCVLRIAAERWAQAGLPVSLAETIETWRWAAPRPATVSELSEPRPTPHIYSTAVKLVEAQYTAGGNWTWVRIGKEPVRGADGNQRLEGNYGVVYRIGLKIENPTAQQQKVEVAFDAGAGPANGVFLVGDQVVDLTGAYAGGERQVAQFQLAPNETRSITIETMPLGGGFYPASLVIR